jgi:hypothetical protein
VLIFFKPKILISPHICKGRLNDSDPTEYYFIKTINISLFSAYDIRFELLHTDKYTAENGQMHTRNTSLMLIADKASHIPGYRPGWIRKNVPYAVRVRTTEKLSEILRNDYKSVKIKVSLRYGLTVLSKVKTKEYTDTSQVKTGRFRYGLNYGVLPNYY